MNWRNAKTDKPPFDIDVLCYEFKTKRLFVASLSTPYVSMYYKDPDTRDMWCDEECTYVFVDVWCEVTLPDHSEHTDPERPTPELLNDPCNGN